MDLRNERRVLTKERRIVIMEKAFENNSLSKGVQWSQRKEEIIIY